MATNSSNKEMSYETKMEVFRHFIYIFEGICILVFNTLIVLTIARHVALRRMKEYTILGALALADALTGLATLSGGLYRIPVWLSGRDTVAASGRFCLLTVHNLLWSWFETASHAMLIVVSLDRVLSLAIATKYLHLTRKYAFGVISISYGTTLVNAMYMFGTNWPITEPIRTEVCWFSHGFGLDGSKRHDIANAVTTLSSIALYMLMPILYKKQSRQVTPTTSENEAYKFQKKLNKAVSLSCAFTFLFVGLPYTIMFVSWFDNIENRKQIEIINASNVWMFIVANVNPAINLFIYLRKQKYFKIGFKALFKNKTLPPVLNTWQTEKSTNRTSRPQNRTSKPQ